MTIQTGDTLPLIQLRTLSGQNPPSVISTNDLFKEKKSLLIGLPGAFTPICHSTHVNGYIDRNDELRALGVDQIIILSVNDSYVMQAWHKALNANTLIFAADGNAEFTTAIGMTFDCTSSGMGIRSKRYLMLVDDNIVKECAVEDQINVLDSTSVDSALSILKRNTVAA